ncbi:MAG: DUF615 domain-containing protein [Gammaproteobacteria bacterium]|jgi:ribosome-associated protein|nr:DUF615 domain-containing protein [Gammaproteobacteria bacterium]MBT3859910.1 DUF615 domain-containing protein [Gammaproteobacteria bacterium]MBT3986372.1 DUF615 domain-containing protein [Gammaproteobacteria bacterium]MBT4255507.1 DUF615 domain-containing protein [Gammaproteobacteria bacterium]MBT4582932.1 DUF615 domain-containing protein [Gammaproteobacteria bacterium]
MGTPDMNTTANKKSEVELEDEPPSKTQLKEEANKLQKLGVELTTLKPTILQMLSLNSRLLAAIEEFNRLPNSHGARRRQLQFIGKLMRDCDYDAITRQIEKLTNPRQALEPNQPEADKWTDKILEAGDPEINQLLELHPSLERQFLRQIYREFSRADENARVRLRKKLINHLHEQLLSSS